MKLMQERYIHGGNKMVKKIAGKNYTITDVTGNKKQAQASANRERRDGYNARVLKFSKAKSEKGSRYGVYVQVKKKKIWDEYQWMPVSSKRRK